MAARTKPNQEFIPADIETQNQIEYGRKMALLEAQNPPPEYETPEPDPDDIALQNVLAELGSSGIDAKVNIYQLDARQNRAFIGAFLPSEFSLERTQSEFGPGQYEIRVYNNGKLATRKVITIAAPKNQALNGNQNNNAPALETQKIVETMQAGFQQLGQMFAQSISALVSNQPKPKSTIETLQEFQLMKDVFGNNQPAQPAQDPMSMITMALELSEKIRPREGEPSAGEIILKAVENFAPTINQIMAQQSQQKAQASAMGAPHMMSMPPHQIPQIPTIPAQQNPIQESDDEMNLMTKVYVKTLLTAAASGAETETYANNILDLLPEETVLNFVNGPDWFAEVLKAVPEAGQHAAWFAQLKSDILELTKPEDASSLEPNANIVPATPATLPNAN